MNKKNYLIWIIALILLAGSVNAYITNIMDNYNKQLTYNLSYYEYDGSDASLKLTIPAGNYSISTHKIILREDYRDLTENKPWYSKWIFGIGAELLTIIDYPSEALCWNVIIPVPIYGDSLNCTIVEVVTQNGNSTNPDFKQKIYSEIIQSEDYGRHKCQYIRDSDSIEVITYLPIDSLGIDYYCRVEFAYYAWDVTENLDYLLNVKKDSNYIRSFNSLLLDFINIVQTIVDMIIELWGIAYWIFKLLVVTFLIGLIIYIFVLVYQIFKNLMES